MTTYVLESTAPTTDQPVALPDTAGEPVTRRHLGLIGAGPGWRCLVAGGHPSVTRWLETRVGETGTPLGPAVSEEWAHGPGGAILEVDDPLAPVPLGWFDLVHVRLGDVHLLDRARAVHNLASAVRPGGWILIEHHVTLPFELPEDSAAAASFATMAEAIRTVAEERGAELDWARRVPALLRARGCSEVAAEGYCSVWPGGSATISLPDSTGGDGTGAGSPPDIPVELEPFRRLLVNPFRGGLVPPALAANSFVLVSTRGRC